MQFEGMAYLRAMLGKEQDLAQIIAKIDVLHYGLWNPGVHRYNVPHLGLSSNPAGPNVISCQM